VSLAHTSPPLATGWRGFFTAQLRLCIFFVPVEAGLTFPMTSPTSTTTKAALSNELEIFQARVASLEDQISTMEQCEVRTTVWINDRITTDTTRSGKNLVRFSGQKSARNQDGTRVYGAYWNFVAYGDMADRFAELAADNQKLVTITAFESPWTNGARKSDFVVLSITPFARPEAAPASESGPAENYGDTHGDDIPF